MGGVILDIVSGGGTLILEKGAEALGYDDVTKTFNEVEAGIKEAGGKVLEGIEAVGGYIADGAVYLYEHDPITQFVIGAASGDNLWETLKKSGALAVQNLATFGPYLAFIPGLGTIASMIIAAGVALAQGKRLTDIMLAAVRGAIPPGPLLNAFDTGIALLQGMSLTEAALAAFEKAYPVAGAALRAAIALAEGKSIAEATISTVRGLLPAEAQGPYDAAVSIAKGKRVQEALMDGVRGALPPEYQTAFNIAADIAAGKNVFEVAMNAVRAELPPEARPYADLGAKILQGGKVADALFDAAKAQIPAEYIRYFDLAMGLYKGDLSGAAAEVKARLPQAMAAAGIDISTFETLGGAARPSDTSRANIPLDQLLGRGTSAPPQTPPLGPGPGAGLSAENVKAVYEQAKALASGDLLTTAIDILRTQVPADPTAQAAFNIAVDLVKGKRIEQIAAEVAKQFVPTEYQATAEKGFNTANKLLQGGGLADLGLETLLLAMPDEAKPYAELAVNLVKGEMTQASAIAAARAQIPAEAIATFEKALSLAKEGAGYVEGASSTYKALRTTVATFHGSSFQATAVAAVKNQLPGNQSLQDTFQSAMTLAKDQIPSDAVATLKAQIPAGAEYKKAFALGLQLAEGAAILSIATAVIESYIPTEFAEAYKKVRDFISTLPSTDAALGALRGALPLNVQNVVDGATGLLKGAPPESILEDPMVFGAVQRVIAYKRAIGEMPPAILKIKTSYTSVKEQFQDQIGPGRFLFAAKTRGDASWTGTAAGVAKEDLETFENAIEDIARRRAALGAINPPTTPIGDSGLRQLLAKRTAAYQAENEARQSSGAAPYLIGAGVLAVGGYLLYRHMEKTK